MKNAKKIPIIQTDSSSLDALAYEDLRNFNSEAKCKRSSALQAKDDGFGNFLRKLIFAISIAAISLQAASVLAWDGYDYDNKTHIEIGQGNLVRENNVIQFYDSKDDTYHTAKILYINSVNGGTQIQLEDLDQKKERIFIMN